jgi:uncharacterized protein YkwD
MVDSLRCWYYMDHDWRDGSKMCGPFTGEEIRDLLEKKSISGKTQIRSGPKSLWQPLGEVPFFSDTVSRSQSKRVRSQFWKRYTTWGIAIAVVACIVLYVLLHKPSHLSIPSNVVMHGNVVTPGPLQEVLNRKSIIDLTNKARGLNGLSVLGENVLLNTIAETRARDMFDKQYFAHVSPTGDQASDIAQRIGYQYKIIAENIGSGTFLSNQKVIDGWMQSPGHRKNILSTEVKELGAAITKGIMSGQETWISVQIFGLQSPPVSQETCVAPSQGLLNDIQGKKAEISELNDSLKRIKQELDSEHASIETDRRLLSGRSQEQYDLSVKIKAYNEKITWHNQRAADMKAKVLVLQSMTNEYNEMLQTYNSCRTSR